MARDTASRYQNSLIYDPSREIGAHPERGFYTAPGASAGNSYSRTPMDFGPEEAWLNGFGPNGAGGQGASSAGLLGDVNMPAGAGVGASLIGLAGKGIGKALQAANAPSNGQGISIMPPDQAAPWLATQPLITSAPAGAGALFDGVSVMPGEDAAAFLASQPLTTGAPTGGLGALTDSVGGFGGGAAPGFSAAPVDALADFGGGAEAAYVNALGDVSGSGGAGLGGGLAQAGLGAAAGALGGWAGNKLGDAAFGAGDPQQRPLTSAGGATIGGLAGTAIGGPIGTLVGSLIGAFAGAAVGGTPDYPMAYFGGSIGSDGQFGMDASGALNGGRRWQADGMSNALSGYLQQRATADGLHTNPGFVNQQVFTAGNLMDGAEGNGGPFFYNVGSRPAAASEHDYRSGSFDDLANFAYGDLTGRGVFTAGGPSWADVQTNLQGQGDYGGFSTTMGESGTVTDGIGAHGWAQNQYMLPIDAFNLPALDNDRAYYADPSYAYGSTPQVAFADNTSGAGG